MASDKQIILVTGGNSGIGYSLAEQLIADSSKHVIITSRDKEKGEKALQELQALKQPGEVEMLQLEVTSPESIAKLGETVEQKFGRLDVLVNNAAQAVAAPGTSTFDHMQLCFAANASGPVFMMETFLPLLRKSKGTPRIINVSSGAGSLGRTLDPNAFGGPLHFPYKSSKAALNMASAVQVAMLRQNGEDMKVFTYCPGFRVSNLSTMNRSENGAGPTDAGAKPMVAMINGEKDEDHGKYPNSEGGYHPW